jgi:hypothetical protein
MMDSPEPPRAFVDFWTTVRPSTIDCAAKALRFRHNYLGNNFT